MTEGEKTETAPVNIGRAAVDAGHLVFGTRLALAKWAGVLSSQTTRLENGQAVGGEGGWRLAVLAAVVTVLLTVYDAEAVPGWLHGSNPALGYRRPIDVLADGDGATVMAAVQAGRLGVFA
jgi:uncharacterized protein (DUF2384 family)